MLAITFRYFFSLKAHATFRQAARLTYFFQFLSEEMFIERYLLDFNPFYGFFRIWIFPGLFPIFRHKKFYILGSCLKVL
jgi:hypothetical protein